MNINSTKKIVALTALLAATTVTNLSVASGGKNTTAFHGGWGIFAGWTATTPIIGISYNPAHEWEIFGKVGYDKFKVSDDKNSSDTFLEIGLGVKKDIFPLNAQSNAYLVGEVLYEYFKKQPYPNYYGDHHEYYKWKKESLWGAALGVGAEYRFTGKQAFQGFYVDVEVGLKYLSGKEKSLKKGASEEEKHNAYHFGTWTAVIAGYRF